MLNRERNKPGQQPDRLKDEFDRLVEPLVAPGDPPLETPRGLHLISNDEAESHRDDPDKSPYIAVETEELELTSDIEGAEPKTVQVNRAYNPESLENLKADNQQEIDRLEAIRGELATNLTAIDAELLAKRGDYSSTSTKIEGAWETKNPEQVTQLLAQGERILGNLARLNSAQQRVADSLDSIGRRLDQVLYPTQNRYDEISQQRRAA